MNLNAKEREVLQSLGNTAMDIASGDFGCMDEVDYAALDLNAQQFGGYVTALIEKKLIAVAEPYRVNDDEGPTIVQYTLDEEAWRIWKTQNAVEDMEHEGPTEQNSPAGWAN